MHCYSRRVEFAETDAAGVVHFTKLLGYVEEAEHDWMRGLGVIRLGEGFGWPRVGVEVRYLAPARFEDLLVVELTNLERQTRGLSYQFVIRREETLICRGQLKIVRVRLEADGSFTPQELPEAIGAIFGPNPTR
jgi:acyl-CoA thioester hydrolase